MKKTLLWPTILKLVTVDRFCVYLIWTSRSIPNTIVFFFWVSMTINLWQANREPWHWEAYYTVLGELYERCCG